MLRSAESDGLLITLISRFFALIAPMKLLSVSEESPEVSCTRSLFPVAKEEVEILAAPDVDIGWANVDARRLGRASLRLFTLVDDLRATLSVPPTPVISCVRGGARRKDGFIQAFQARECV